MRNATNEMCAMVQFLESAESATLEVQRLHRRLDALDERRKNLRLEKGAVARKLSRLIDDEHKRELTVVNEELESYRRVEAFVARVPKRVHRTILRRRYLDVGKSWTEIQDALADDGLFYSHRHLLRLHAEALEAAQKLWREERKWEEGTERR